MGDEVSIYKLIDPTTNYVKYVGWTHKPLQKRLGDHLSDARRGQKNYRCNWIRNLLSNGFYPLIDIIEKVNYNERSEKEKYWISYYGRENLVNGTDGGEGVSGLLVSDETKKKLSLSHKGQIPWNKGISINCKHDAQFIKGHVPWNKNILCSDETKNKISKTKNGKSTGKRNIKYAYFGITYEKTDNIWISQITYMTKKYFIGRYDSDIKAAIAYDICSIWFSKDNRNLNFPDKRNIYLILLSNNRTENLKELRKIIKSYTGGLNYGNKEIFN
jgi:hypothetical protein